MQVLQQSVRSQLKRSERVGFTARLPRILIIEDEPVLALDLACAVFDRSGVTAGPASTAEAATTIIKSRRIDGAIVDVRLSDCQGFDLADSLLRAGIPFVFYTGSDLQSIPQRLHHVPCLQKPASSVAVVNRLLAIMESGSSPRH